MRIHNDSESRTASQKLCARAPFCLRFDHDVCAACPHLARFLAIPTEAEDIRARRQASRDDHSVYKHPARPVPAAPALDIAIPGSVARQLVPRDCRVFLARSRFELPACQI